MKAIIGKKLGMTQVFEGDKVIPATVIEAGPCKVLLQRTKEKDGYEALQLGYEGKSKVKSPAKGEARQRRQKSKVFKYLREFRDEGGAKVGDELTVSMFQEGDKVKLSGISKGKGFQGGVKRHGFSGRNATHGVKHEERTIGSTGTRFPQRVIKGRRMPGRMGAERVTVRNLKVVKVDAGQNLLVVSGAVPGRRGTLLEIRAE